MSEPQAAEAAPEAVESVESPEISDIVSDAPEVLDAVEANPEAAEAIAEAVESGDISEATAIEIIKVDGKEIVRDLPFEVDPNNKDMIDFLTKELQLGAMGNKRAQEKAEFEKLANSRESEMEAFLNNLKDADVLESVLAQLGHDPNQLAENILMKEIEKSKLSPEQLELQEVKAELARIRESEEAAKSAAEQAKQQQLEDKYVQDFDRDLQGAIDKFNLPSEPHIIREMSNLMRIALTNNLDLSFDEIGQVVKDQNDSQVKAVLKGLSADQLLEILQDNQLNEIVMKKAPKAKKEAPPTTNTINEGGEKKKKVKVSNRRTESADDFFAKLIRGK